MKLSSGLAILALAAAPAAAEEAAPLLTRAETEALAAEISGASAKRTIEALSLHHRMRGSEGFRAAAELIRDRLAGYGLKEVEIIRLPADGKIFYGTQRSRPAWNAGFAELWERKLENGRWQDAFRVASWADQPITLAQDSVSGGADAELVDIGAGTSAGDYEGKDIAGKLVLTSSQPGEVAPLAFGTHKAAGIVSWAQNQRQAWWGEDEELIRWGHLDTWEHPGFAFMVSPARARGWQERLGKGKRIRLRAEVKAGRSPGAYLIPTAVIPGRERNREIVFSCHLDHPSPGANDNASGCSGILEVARSLSRLIAEKRLPQPKRTIRFVWPSEIEGTIALLNGRPEFARRTLATIHLDMIGGRTEITRGSLRVEGSPPSLPSFVADIGFGIARWVNAQTLDYQDRGVADFPLTDAEGDKRALGATIGGFSEGSDHQIWAEGSWRIPVIYLSDWPDLYIHTHKDVPANIDTTKLKRAIFIAAGSAWVLANIEAESEELAQLLSAEVQQRLADATRRASGLADHDLDNFRRHRDAYELAVAESLSRFGVGGELRARPIASAPADPAEPDQAIVYRRNPRLKGPMDGFGYSWLDHHLSRSGLARPTLLSRTSAADGISFGYEALNLVDGKRSVADIGKDLAATVGPAPAAELGQYFSTLERLGVIERVAS